MLNAKNGVLVLENRTMDYVSFGRGRRPLIIIPGLSDGLKTVKGIAFSFAWMFRAFATDYRVYVLSRINQLEKGYTTKDMANDIKRAMDALEIPSASLIGDSMGGMIAQWFALDYPNCVEKLVLTDTLSRPNAIGQERVGSWIIMAKNGDYKQLMSDTAKNTYSKKYLHSHRWILPLLGLTGKPKSFCRFIIQAESCLKHNTYERLPEIKRPTLILGGSADMIVGPQASQEIAAQISGSELYIYEGLGHAPHTEAKDDFCRRIMRFLSN